MELERMPPGPETSRRAASSASSARRSAASMEHLNLSLPLNVQVPPLPSPNTTAAAAALFRVNQLPPTASPTVPHSSSSSSSSVFSFAKPLKRPRDTDAHLHALTLSLPTPTTAAAAAAAMALSASSPASAASGAAVDEHNKTAASNSMSLGSAKGLASPGGEGSASNRRRKVGIPKFLRFLFQMLEYEDQQVISWSHDGTAFQIRDPDELAERVLPKYFKHNKVSSFQRQLNYFGFKKWTKTQTNICTFSHPCFVRDEQENMRLIKRKERSTRGGGASGGGGGAKEDEDNDDEQDEPDAEALSDEQDGHYKHARPAKRAKVQPPAATAKQRPTSAAGRRAAASTASKQDNKTKAASSKPPRAAKKSPRGRRGTAAGLRGFGDEEEGDNDETSGRGRKLQLPTISPASSASVTSFSRLVSHSGDGSPTAQSSAMYSRGGIDEAGSDAAPVMPISADMMIQQYGRRSGGGSIYDSGGSMQDLSESFGVGGQNAWQSSYGLSSFKFSDPSALESSFDMGTSSSVGGGASGNGGSSSGYSSAPLGMTNTKDYLDVLLESANMDDQISAQSSVGSNDSGIWEPTYRNSQPRQYPHPHQLFGNQSREPTHLGDRRMTADAAMATYNMLTGSHSQHSDTTTGSQQTGMQLPSIEDLQGMRY